jgi:hypothetical protein
MASLREHYMVASRVREMGHISMKGKGLQPGQTCSGADECNHA